MGSLIKRPGGCACARTARWEAGTETAISAGGMRAGHACMPGLELRACSQSMDALRACTQGE
eukprot:1160574-Pelagomonas_calceolata.AAC.6